MVGSFMHVGSRVGDSLGLLMVRVVIADPVVISSQDSGKEKEKPYSSLSGKESSPPDLPANFSSAALATIVPLPPHVYRGDWASEGFCVSICASVSVALPLLSFFNL